MFPLRRLHMQPEFMARYRTSSCAGRRPTPGDVTLFKTARIEHLLQARGGSIMEVMASVPHAFERRHFVVASALTRL